MVHIHVGTETCDQCEPGQLQQAPMINSSEQLYCTVTTCVAHNYIVTLASSKRSIAGQRKDELQRLKKKYGLQVIVVNNMISLVHYTLYLALY